MRKIDPGVFPYMAYTGMCRWTGYKISHESVLNRVYNYMRVCPNYKQSIACEIYLIWLIIFFLYFQATKVINVMSTCSIAISNKYVRYAFCPLS